MNFNTILTILMQVGSFGAFVGIQHVTVASIQEEVLLIRSEVSELVRLVYQMKGKSENG